ncbi:unnamed protein product [Rodentolepis nana]|uniref:Uncharacterized protein n=1 Tax=Rodentolepis nana TaxID=102285 RepID=A0A0R3T505_RODNA|nr:unnamed protein product [Rodentolepis nana]
MGEFGKSVGAYIQAYRKVLKITAIVVLVISLILLIAGSVLVALNRSFFDASLDLSIDKDEAYFDEEEATAKKIFAGFALLATGFLLLLVTASMGCTILECGIFGKLVESGSK